MDQARADKIKALLAKANDAATTPEESEAYQAKAADLMTKWQIDEAMLANDSRVVTDTIVKRTVQVAAPKIYQDEFVVVAVSVAAGFGLQQLIKREHVKQGDRYVVSKSGKFETRPLALLIGFTADLDVIEQVIYLVHAQVTSAWTKYGTTLPGYLTPSEKYNAKRSFLVGFASRIEDRIRASRKSVIAEITETHGTGTELVLLDREKQVDAWIAANVTLGRGKSKRYGSNGMGAGSAAADSTDIGQTRIGASRRALGN